MFQIYVITNALIVLLEFLTQSLLENHLINSKLQNRFGDKKIITAFTPRLAFMETNMASFFDAYPDGRLISVVRDPKNWFPSANRHQTKKYGDIAEALDQWNDSARSMVRNKKKYGDRVCIITFEDLVTRTGPVMRYLSDFPVPGIDDGALRQLPAAPLR